MIENTLLKLKVNKLDEQLQELEISKKIIK